MPAKKNDGISRLERAALARKLRDMGWMQDEIAKALGISRSYVSGLLQDPDGSKDRVRKEKYRGTCIECGGITTYGKETRRCVKCARKNAPKKWTRERMIADIRRWNDLYGQPPRSQDWLYYTPSDGKWGSREWPHVSAIQKEFGSWSNGIEAAGFKRRVNYKRTPEWKAKVTKWSKERIIEAMQRWEREHGSAPRQLEWKCAGEYWPSASSAYKRFGSWKAALDAAGLKSARRYRSDSALSQWEEGLLGYRNGGKGETPIPSFAERGEGRSLTDIVHELSERR